MLGYPNFKDINRIFVLYLEIVLIIKRLQLNLIFK